MPNKKIKINRAPVLTLWAAVVAERMGYKKDEALTFGKAVAGLNAQSKGRRLRNLRGEKRRGKGSRQEERETGRIYRAVGPRCSSFKNAKGIARRAQG